MTEVRIEHAEAKHSFAYPRLLTTLGQSIQLVRDLHEQANEIGVNDEVYTNIHHLLGQLVGACGFELVPARTEADMLEYTQHGETRQRSAVVASASSDRFGRAGEIQTSSQAA